MGTNNGDVALSSNSFDLLIIDIMKSAQNINVILNNIIQIMDQTGEHYLSENATILRKKFEEEVPHFKNIIRNIENSAFTLKNIKMQFEETEAQMKQRIISDAENININ